MDRFLLAENVNRGSYRPLYILQTVKYKILIEIVPFDNEEELIYDLDEIFDFFSYINSYDLLEKYMLVVREFYDLFSDQEIDLNMEKIRKDLKKAFNWYRSYLEKSEAEIDEEAGQNNPSLN